MAHHFSSGAYRPMSFSHHNKSVYPVVSSFATLVLAISPYACLCFVFRVLCQSASTLRHQSKREITAHAARACKTQVFAGVVVVAHACMVLVVLGQGLLIFMGWEGKTEKNERQTVFPAPAEGRASVATDWSFLGSQGGLHGNEKDGGGGGGDDNGEGSGGGEVSTRNPLYAESNDDGGRDGGGFGHPRRRHAGAGREDNGHAGVSAGGDAENADEGEEVKGEEVAAPAAQESLFPVSPSGPRRQMPEQQATYTPGSSAAVVASRSNPTGGAQEGHELNVSEDYSVVLSDADFAGTAAADGFSTI